MSNRLLGVVVALAAIATAIGLTTLTFAPAIQGPPHICRGYIEVKPKHPNSDLYGGAITTWMPHCWLVKR